MAYASASAYWQARREREAARAASRRAAYVGTARGAYIAPPATHCKHCGAKLFPASSLASGRCTGPLTCPNAYCD